MNIVVRFYWQHDLDLIALAKNPEFSIGIWMKKAVIAYARGESFRIPLPINTLPATELTSCITHFGLNPNTEQDVIDVLNGFRSGFRNSALKIIFRTYLDVPKLDPFFNNSDYIVKTRRKKKTDSGKAILPRPKATSPTPPKVKALPDVTPSPAKPVMETQEKEAVQKPAVTEADVLETAVHKPSSPVQEEKKETKTTREAAVKTAEVSQNKQVNEEPDNSGDGDDLFDFVGSLL